MAARRLSTWERVRRDMYKTQRAMGDVSAAARGPVPLARRLARRRVTRSVFRLFR